MAPIPAHWYDIGAWIAWLLDEFKLLFVWIFEQLFAALVAVLSAIPVPNFLENMGSLSLPPSVSWLAQALELQAGVGIIVAAYTLRFILRRIPFIGG